MNDSFSWSRTWALTQYYFTVNRRSIFITMGVIAGAFLMVSMLVFSQFSPSSENQIQESLALMAVLTVFLGCAAMQVLGSLTFSSMISKGKRLNALMLPARESEKFIGQWLLYVVFGNIALMVAIILSLAISTLIFYHWEIFPVLKGMIRHIFSLTGHETQVMVLIVLAISGLALLTQSVYVFGSALWPKRSFLKTFVALLFINTILPIILPMETIAEAIASLALPEVSNSTVMLLAWIGISLEYLLIAGMYTAAWWRYRRLELVKNLL